jgi:hypothetical protein
MYFQIRKAFYTRKIDKKNKLQVQRHPPSTTTKQRRKTPPPCSFSGSGLANNWVWGYAPPPLLGGRKEERRNRQRIIEKCMKNERKK